MTLIRSLAAALLLACALPASADIFKCTDPISGKVTYTNTKIGEKGCTLLSKDQNVSAVPANGAKKPAASPTDFPKVDNSTQRARDNDRRKILETELASEERALESAKKELAEQESMRSGGERNFSRVQERVKPFQDQVELHERNVEAIRAEIAKLR
ncbi:hypothetical protein GCM10025771_18510 [Niveibacterium umoris]|uniref:Septal ring factor EnvC (AmiA/AmiB activator) n=1 Tax=Niveibacterium umoris TaxID=1193620 RepID=A0A840BIZ8_9RHOO|nr:DUF4124 domain-containing protein [Niveibacterium umoris]MBB4012960.1 septal ring factor EnvC (AmiA/AmiB activator) [Niveibacterium umoris]